jgi:hypothetical protein
MAMNLYFLPVMCIFILKGGRHNNIFSIVEFCFILVFILLGCLIAIDEFRNNVEVVHRRRIFRLYYSD